MLSKSLLTHHRKALLGAARSNASRSIASFHNNSDDRPRLYNHESKPWDKNRFFSSSQQDNNGVSTHDSREVEVSQTSASDSDVKKGEQESKSDSAAAAAANTQEETDETKTSKPQRSKPNQQVAEEELYQLQSALRQHHQHANYTEALKTAQEILDVSIETFGKDHPSSASAHNNVGLMHKMLGNFDQSREQYHTALRVYGDVVGKDHASYAAALNNLGNLDRAQSMTDEDLTAVQRLQLNDTAVEYFEEAWTIRVAELGEDHMHTVTSRSNLGGSIAAQVIQSESIRQEQLKRDEEDVSSSSSSSINSSDRSKGGEGSTWKMTQFSKKKWDLAEDHLRSAFITAINNPRGKRVDIPVQLGKKNNDSRLPPRRSKGMSKKEKHKAAKVRKQMQKKLDSSNETIQEEQTEGSTSSTSTSSILLLGDTSIRTLSSAAAAQNLAVFLKSRADLIRSSKRNEDTTIALDEGDMYAEAKNLYIGALRVRNELKGSAHPDTIATKFSLAELIETVGDEKEANKLRSEIIEEYGVEEVDLVETKS